MNNSLWVSTGVQLMTPEKERPHKAYAAIHYAQLWSSK